MATFIFTFECCLELYTDVVQTFTVRHLHSSRKRLHSYACYVEIREAKKIW